VRGTCWVEFTTQSGLGQAGCMGAAHEKSLLAANVGPLAAPSEAHVPKRRDGSNRDFAFKG